MPCKNEFFATNSMGQRFAIASVAAVRNRTINYLPITRSRVTWRHENTCRPWFEQKPRPSFADIQFRLESCPLPAAHHQGAGILGPTSHRDSSIRRNGRQADRAGCGIHPASSQGCFTVGGWRDATARRDLADHGCYSPTRGPDIYHQTQYLRINCCEHNECPLVSDDQRSWLGLHRWRGNANNRHSTARFRACQNNEGLLPE